MYDTVKTLKEKGVPIDVVGMQMHLLLEVPVPPKKEDVIATMKKFADLGVKIYITELDVDLQNQLDQRLQFQANLYKDMMDACQEFGVCESFTTWGISNSTSWLTCNYSWCVKQQCCPINV